jgi:hypothetical protein
MKLLKKLAVIKLFYRKVANDFIFDQFLVMLFENLAETMAIGDSSLTFE